MGSVTHAGQDVTVKWDSKIQRQILLITYFKERQKMLQILHCRGEVMCRKAERILVLQENPKHKEHTKGIRKLKQRNVFSILLILSHSL